MKVHTFISKDSDSCLSVRKRLHNGRKQRKQSSNEERHCESDAHIIRRITNVQVKKPQKSQSIRAPHTVASCGHDMEGHAEKGVDNHLELARNLYRS